MSRRIFTILSVLILVSMLLVACGPAATEAPKQEAPKQEAPTEAPKVEAPKGGAPADCAGDADQKKCAVFKAGDSIKIGFGGPMTGDASAFGVDISNSGLIAAKDAGEFEGLKIELVVQDDQGSGEGGAAVANKFVSDPQVVAIAGHIFSGATAAAIPIYTKARLPMLSPSATRGDLTKGDQDVFNRIPFTDDMQGEYAAKYLYNNLGAKKLAVMHDGDAYGKGLAEKVRDVFKSLGGEVVAEEAVTVGEKDFSAVLTSVGAKKPDAIYFGGYYAEAAVIANQKANAGMEKAIFFSDDGTFGADFLKLAAKNAEGVYATTMLPVDSEPKGKFDAAYKAAYGKAPGEMSAYTWNGYDVVAALIDAIKKVAVKGDDGNIYIPRDALVKAVRGTKDFDGFSGKITCQTNGECNASGPTFMLVKDAKWGKVAMEGTGAPAAAAPAAGGAVKIGLSFSDFATERWKNEATLMEKLLKEKGYEVMIQEANHDVKLQNDQIDNMVAQGAKALIVIAEDGDAASTAVDKAAQAGVKVIAYDRLIKTASVSAYISFDNVEVGRQQAAGVLKALDIDNRKDPVKMVKLGGSPTDNNAILFRKGQDEVLQKYVDSKKIEVVSDQWVDNWDPANALKLMENVLTAAGNKVDAVVASNDGTALGALQAMKAQKLAGVVPISGQDATADGCNSIVKGELTVTIFKDIRKLSPLATDLVDKLLKGETVSELKKFTMAELTNDPAKTGDVNALFLPVVQVTKDNVFDEIVKSGFQTYDDVYRDIPEGSRPPKPEAGAAAAPAEAGKALPADTYIPVISKGFQHQFWQAVKLGSEKAAAEFGVKITFEGPETEAMVDKQMEMLQTAIDKKPGAICFAAVDSKAAIPLLEKAKAAGIPVIGFDSGVDSDIPLSTAATDNIAAAAMAADKMAELIGGKGEVAIIAHDQTSRTGIDRVKGFTDEIKAKYPDITIVDTQYGGGDQLKSTDIAKAIISSKPNLKGFFGANEGSIIGVLNAVTELKMEGKIVVIGYDSGKQQIDAIKSGVEAGAITQDPIGIGYKCVEAAVKALKGEKLDKFINTGFHWFDKTNIDADDIKPLLYQ